LAVLIDLERGDLPPSGTSDVLIVGAGPAGLTLAAELAESGARITIVESGSADSPERYQRLGHLEISGYASAPDPTTRARTVGGTSANWNTFVDQKQPWARLVPMDAGDFEPSPLRPDATWPITFDEVRRHYPRAHAVAGVNEASLRIAARRADSPGQIASPLLRSNVETFVTANRFRRELPARFSASSNVSLVVGGTVTALNLASDRTRATGVEVRSLDGKSIRLECERLVLATGGIENARLLLAAGFEHPALGRYFSDHHQLDAGRFRVTSADSIKQVSLYDFAKENGAFFNAKPQFVESVRQSQPMLNAAFSLRPLLKPLRSGSRVGAFSQAGMLAFAAAKLGVRQRAFPPKLGSGYWAGLPFAEKLFAGLEVRVQIEQAPLAENRVYLGRTRDQFGMPRAGVISRLSEADLASAATASRLFAEALKDSGVGELEAPVAPPSPDDIWRGMAHHMCTTRMHDNPAQGVINRDCLVHGTANLYCAGSSVFATGGYANPTLTLLALSVRLADHLRADLGSHASASAGSA